MATRRGGASVPSSQFLKLSHDKQQQILDASLAEFAAHGYDLASTNRIVQEAGISKGVLFKYFRDKEALFAYVCDRATQQYVDTLPLEPAKDLLDFIHRTTAYKMRWAHHDPLSYQLLVRVSKEPRHPVYAKVLATQQQLIQEVGTMFETALPQDELRPGLTWRHVTDFMSWVAAGLQEKFMDSMPDVVDEGLEHAYQPMIDELNILLDILKYGIYKGGPRP